MDTSEQLIKLVETSARTEEKVDSLSKRFAKLELIVTRVESLEKSRAWTHGVGWMLGVLWAALLAFLKFHRR